MTVILARIARAVFRFVDLIEMDIIDYAIGFFIIFTRSRLMRERLAQRQLALPCFDINIAVILALDIVRRLDEKIFGRDLTVTCKRRCRRIPFLPHIRILRRPRLLRTMIEYIVRLHPVNLRRIHDFLRIAGCRRTGVTILKDGFRFVFHFGRAALINNPRIRIYPSIHSNEICRQRIQRPARRSVVRLCRRSFCDSAKSHIYATRLDIADAILFKGDLVAVYRIFACLLISSCQTAEIIVLCGIAQKLDRIFDAIGFGSVVQSRRRILFRVCIRRLKISCILCGFIVFGFPIPFEEVVTYTFFQQSSFDRDIQSLSRSI